MATSSASAVRLHGVMAHFSEVNALKAAATKVRKAGFSRVKAYTPFPIEGLAEILGFEKNAVPFLVLVAGIVGLLSGLALQVYTQVIDYPLNIGGRPYFSLPAFVPVTFECTILFAALTAAIGMIVLNGLPELYHPVFNVAQFSAASDDGFFLCVEAADPKFDKGKVAELLKSLKPEGVYEVPA